MVQPLPSYTSCNKKNGLSAFTVKFQSRYSCIYYSSEKLQLFTNQIPQQWGHQHATCSCCVKQGMMSSTAQVPSANQDHHRDLLKCSILLDMTIAIVSGAYRTGKRGSEHTTSGMHISKKCVFFHNKMVLT